MPNVPISHVLAERFEAQTLNEIASYCRGIIEQRYLQAALKESLLFFLIVIICV